MTGTTLVLARNQYALEQHAFYRMETLLPSHAMLGHVMTNEATDERHDSRELRAALRVELAIVWDQSRPSRERLKGSEASRPEIES